MNLTNKNCWNVTTMHYVSPHVHFVIFPRTLLKTAHDPSKIMRKIVPFSLCIIPFVLYLLPSFRKLSLPTHFLCPTHRLSSSLILRKVRCVSYGVTGNAWLLLIPSYYYFTSEERCSYTKFIYWPRRNLSHETHSEYFPYLHF